MNRSTIGSTSDFGGRFETTSTEGSRTETVHGSSLSTIIDVLGSRSRGLQLGSVVARRGKWSTSCRSPATG